MERTSQIPAPFVSIVMPCRNESAYLDDCLKSILAQDYPRDRIEILVAEGESTDGTARTLENAARLDPRIRVVENPDRIQSAGLNRLLAIARGEVIVRMDAHCVYAADYVSRCVEALNATGAAAVGGAQRIAARTPFQRAVRATLSSWLGTAGAPHRSADHEGPVESVFLGAFPRETFTMFGMYDPCASAAEDAELNQRIVDGGGKLYMSRAIVVHYYPRETFVGLARQYFNYGKGRARTFLKHGHLLTLRPTTPFLAAAGLATALVLRPLRRVAAMSIGAYAAVAVFEAFRARSAVGVAGVPLVASLFAVLHVSHAAGFGIGLARYSLRPDWAAVERSGRGSRGGTFPRATRRRTMA